MILLGVERFFLSDKRVSGDLTTPQQYEFKQPNFTWNARQPYKTLVAEPAVGDI